MADIKGVESENERAMLELVKEFDGAWNDHDVNRFSSFFTEDTDMHFITLGMRMRGRGEVAQTYTKIFSEIASGVQHKTTLKEIHPITPDVILLDGITDIVQSNEKGTETVLRRHTGATVLLRTDAGWRIRAMRIWTEQVSEK
jgi:uncharacterized protein (TIGR02246 family)